MGSTARERILERANAIGVVDEPKPEPTAKDRILSRAQQMGKIKTVEPMQQRSRQRSAADDLPDIAAFGAGNYGADKRVFGEDYNVGQGLAKAGQMGLTQVAKTGSSAGAWLENLLGDFAREGTNGYWDPDTSKWLFNRWNKAIDAEAEGVQQRYAENTRHGGKAAEVLEDVGAATVAAAPQAVAAILTGGASTAATAEQLAARAAASQGVMGTISRAMQTMGKDPNFRLAFAQVAGPGYEQAKADGADDLRASLYAIGNGLMNAAVEAGGGIQTLPGELKGGTSAWKAWVDSMLDEGKEEAVQGVIERAMQNAMYGKDNPLVGVGKGAVLDPAAAAEEFAGGAVVGGLLGGGQIGVQQLQNGGEYARENSPVQGAEHSRQQEGGTVAPLGVSATQESNSSITHGPVDGNRLGEILAQIKNGRMDANDGLGAADRGFDPFTAAQNEYGTLPGGENPVRSDDVPRSTDGSDRVSQSTVTFKGAKVTPDEFVPLMENETMKGGFSFIPVTNSETVQAATERIMERGWESSLSDWTSDVRAGRTNESIIATGVLLYNNAVNSGKYDLALDIMADYMQAARNGARALQAARILKTLSPGSRLYMMRQSVARLAEQAGLPKDIRIDEDLERAYLEAPDDAARDAVIGQIQQDIADQLPSSILEKWVALRYTNMLGNFKTQARNVFGNVSMQAIQGTKDKIAAGLEAIAYRASGGKFERTKSVTVSRDLLKAAKADYANVKSAALGEGKYRDSGLTADDFARGVQEKRTIFKNNGDWGKRDTSGAAARAARTTTDVLLKGAEAYRKATNDAMEFGDVIFSKHTYARALAGYLKAHHVTAEQFSSAEWQGSHGELVDKARAYAIKQAQEATFRDSNTYSNWVSRIGRRRDTPKAVRVVSEGMAPFRKTPANVAVRAVEYSPLGLMETAVTEVKRRRGAAGKTRFADADITGADVINQLAKSLTGTGLFVLGMALRNGGLLRGGDSDDDREASFDDLIGRQAYSLELPNGFSYTLDWLSPTAIPLFMGAQLEDLRQDGDIELKDLERALTTIAEPMLQMSMLSSVDDTLNKLKYSEDNLGQMLVTQALSYLTQGLTNSLVGQIERISEDVSMRTYKDKNSPLPNWLQGEIGRASAKTPGWDYNQIPYIDAWGREQETGDILTRILINAASPGYVSKVEMDSVEQELSRLGKLVGSSVYPDKADKSFDVNGETKNLTAQEYVKYAKTLGQNRHKMLEQAMKLPGYKSMKSADKAKMIATMYEYANAKAKKAVAPKFTMTTEMEKYAEAEKAGISPAEWYVLKKRADADGNGSINQKEAKTALDRAGLTRQEKAALWPLISAGWKNNPYK